MFFVHKLDVPMLVFEILVILLTFLLIVDLALEKTAVVLFFDNGFLLILLHLLNMVPLMILSL